uniref:Uncharacterized protein n=1 Tax=Phlebotomus papatasi TaxID=29031 RepID=A0A1B0DL07_PHLPP
MSANPKKTKYVSFGCDPGSLHILLANSIIEEVAAFRYLGVQIDNRLKFESHVTDLATRLAALTGALRRNLNGSVSQQTRRAIYHSMYQSILSYGAMIYKELRSEFNEKMLQASKAKAAEILRDTTSLPISAPITTSTTFTQAQQNNNTTVTIAQNPLVIPTTSPAVNGTQQQQYFPYAYMFPGLGNTGMPLYWKSVQCHSKRTCLQCGNKHHTLLHFTKGEKKETPESNNLHTNTENNQEEVTETINLHTTSTSPLFPTALIKVQNQTGAWTLMRALLDTGSGDTFITEAAAQELRLPRKKVIASIKAIGDTVANTTKHEVQILMTPRFPSTFKATTNAFVLPTLTGLLPASKIKSSQTKGFSVDNIMLADPHFDTPANIDLILGTRKFSFMFDMIEHRSTS